MWFTWLSILCLSVMVNVFQRSIPLIQKPRYKFFILNRGVKKMRSGQCCSLFFLTPHPYCTWNAVGYLLNYAKEILNFYVNIVLSHYSPVIFISQVNNLKSTFLFPSDQTLCQEGDQRCSSCPDPCGASPCEIRNSQANCSK